MRRVLIAATFTIALALSACAGATAKTYDGKLEVLHADDFKHDRGQVTWTLRTKHGRVPIVPTALPTAGSGDKVAVRGKRAGHWLEGKVVRRGGPRLRKASALGPHSVAVILVNFDGSQPWTPAHVADRIFNDTDSTAAFYAEESHGDITLSGHVFGWYTIAGPATSCDYLTWANQARAAATADGHDLTAYDHIQYVFPYQSSCGWAGLGYMPGRDTWLNGYIEPWVAAHELGHNMGLHHSSSYRCTAGGVAVTWSSNCTASEYGDPYDVMGTSDHHNNAWQLARLGIIPASNVQTVSANGTYTIKSALNRGSGTNLLRVPSGNGSPARYYDLSMRESGGVFDSSWSSASLLNGVSIHWDPALGYTTQSLMLDGTPNTPGDFTDGALPPGSTFNDGNVSITVDSASAGTATVTVVTGAGFVDTQSPTVPGNFTATAVQGGADLSWSAAADNVGVVSYRIIRDNAIVGSTSGLSWSDRNLAPGSPHSYRVQAMDAAGNGTPSAIRFVTVPAAPDPGPGSGGDDGSDPSNDSDLTAPVVNLLSPKQRARLRRRAVVNARASDDTAVAEMELTIDGRRVTAVRGASLKRTWLLRRVKPGTHTVRIRAIDSSGNASVRAVRVRVLRGP